MPDPGPVSPGSAAPATSRPVGRPRPPATDRAIVKATIELLAEVGADATTLDAIARRSGSAKTTIYRRWPSREALILDALRAAVRGSDEQLEAIRELDRALGSTVRGSTRNILALVQNSVFRAAFPTIAHELFEETDLGNRFRADVFRPIRANTKARLSEGIRRGEIRSGVDLDLLLDALNGAVLYRALVGEPIDPPIADALADLLLRGVAGTAASAGRETAPVRPNGRRGGTRKR